MKFVAVIDELRQAWRTLLRRPGYLALASLTLALGVATTAAVFSLVDQALLRPLNFPASGQLVSIGMSYDDRSNSGAPAFYQQLQGMPGVKAMGIATGYTNAANIAYDDVAASVNMMKADRGFLATLGAPMALGRNFNAEEDLPNGPGAVILRYEFWRDHFGADPDVLHRTLQVEGQPATVVGVLPPDFSWFPFDVLMPMQLPSDSQVTATNEMIVARLAEGSRMETVSAQIDTRLRAYVRSLHVAGDDYSSRVGFSALPLLNQFTRNSRRTLGLFFAAAACVLLIAAINLTNLMMLRSIARSHDSAVRAALGAPTVRMAMPALAEGVLIGVLGSLAGLTLAWVGLRLLAALVPPDWLRGSEVHLTGATWWFALVVGAGVAVLAAALGVWRGQQGSAMQELVGGGRTGWSRGASRLGRALVTVQAAVAVVLLLCAALFTRSLQQLSTVPMGFESRSVLTFSLSPVKHLYVGIAAVDRQSRQITERLRQIPGVEAVGISTNLPTASQFNMPATLPRGQSISVQYRPISAGYLATFAIPVLAGRGINEQDAAGAEPVCMVSAAFAARYLGRQPLGQVVRGYDKGGMRVIGVVGDVRQYGPAEPAPPMLYVPLAQMKSETWSLVSGFLPLRYAVRVRGEPLALEPGLRAALHEVSPLQPIAGLRSMEAVVASTTSEQKLNLLLVGLFAGLALLLASVGLYAVMAVAVSARQQELGVRAALGASPVRLLGLVLKEGGQQVGLGLLIGLAVALAASRLIQRFLFGISSADPTAIVVVLAALLVAGGLASLVPALRAARVSPLLVLRAG